MTKADTLANVLANFPRVQLAHLPTPLEVMPQLSRHMGDVNIYIKRDDCTGLYGGGNKARKLEFVVGEALQRGADTLITTGGPQSNHARQTAAVAAKFGLRCILLLEPVFEQSVDMPGDDYLSSGNLLLSRLAGAEVRLLQSADKLSEQLEAAAAEARAEGCRPFIIPAGASTATGSLGYVNCAREILCQAKSQEIVFDSVVHATGSCGTQAGLMAGFSVLGQKLPVTGIAVGSDEQEQFRRARITQLMQQILELLGVETSDAEQPVYICGDYHGGGYGLADNKLFKVIADVARLEGIALDPVYSGKAMMGLLDLVEKGLFSKGANILFLHTGGAPALFAYKACFDGGQFH